MHGVTRPVTLDVEGPSPSVKDLDGRTRIGASATTTVNRRDFGLQYNELIETGGAVVGDEVRIAIDIEMTHK
jgi:polyisoprenoid-binding protein YceI